MHRNLDRVMLRYTTGEMRQDERDRFESHLATCVRCQQALAEWNALVDGVRENAQVHAASLPPLEFARLELRSLGEEKMIHSAFVPAPLRSPHPFPRAYGLMVAVLSLTVVVVFSSVFLRGGNSSGGFISPALVEATPEVTATPFPAGARLIVLLQDIPEGYDLAVVAVVNIRSGSVIRDDQVILYALPNRIVSRTNDPLHPYTPARALDLIVGRIAQTNLYCGQIISSAMVADSAYDVQQWMPAPGGPACETYSDINGFERRVSAVLLTEPVETTQVVVAARPYLAGTVIDETGLIVDDYPTALVPSQALTTLEAVSTGVLGSTLINPMVVVSDMLKTIIPVGMAGITIPFSHTPVAFNHLEALQVGNYVGISGSIMVLGGQLGVQTPVRGLDYVSDMQVVGIGPLGITLAGTASDVARVQAMLDAGTDISFVKGGG